MAKILILLMIFFVLTAVRPLDYVDANNLTTVCSEKKDKSFHIIVLKKERQLYVCKNTAIIKNYPIALGWKPEGDKEKEGDLKTPEGEFKICAKKEKGLASYLLPKAIMINYPNKAHADRGLKTKLISRKEYNQIINALNNNQIPPQQTKLGGELYLHGSHIESDWTLGCIAMTWDDVTELYNMVKIGMKIVIYASYETFKK